MLIEVTIRNILDIESVIEKIKETGADEVALTDKNGMPDNLIAADAIMKAVQGIKVTTYYSLKNHTNKVIEKKYEHFQQYFERAITVGVDTVLLVSGSPRPKFDSLQAIDYLKVTKIKLGSVKLAVAYNPFYTDSKLDEENARLALKAKTGFVDKVYLQIGTDIDSLKNGIALIRKLLPKATIGGSLMLPTAFLMSRFAVRPWTGVVVSEEFLGSVEGAQKVNKELLLEYKKLEVKPIFGVYTITPDSLTALNALL
jgi:5,10-methylenetetrahydrofolate reductase